MANPDVIEQVTAQGNEYLSVLAGAGYEQVVKIALSCDDLAGRYPLSRMGERRFSVEGWEGKLLGPQVAALLLASTVRLCQLKGYSAYPIPDDWPGLLAL